MILGHPCERVTQTPKGVMMFKLRTTAMYICIYINRCAVFIHSKLYIQQYNKTFSFLP